MKITRPLRLLVVALLLAPVAFFWPLFVPLPDVQQTIIAGDFLYEYYPQRIFVSRELWRLRLPVWNPHIYAGNPGLAEPQMGTFYPITWLTTVLGGPGGPPWWLVELEAVAHLGLAGLFMFLLVRRRLAPPLPPPHSGGGAETGALVAAVAYMFGGYLTSWPLNQLSVLESSIWLPLVLFLLDLGAERGLRYFALAGVAWAVSFFAGHPQAPLYAAYAAGFYVLTTLPWPPRRDAWLRAAAGLVVFGALALGLSAVQLLPMRELEQTSIHTQIPLDMQAHGLGPAEIGALLVPLHWGNQAVYAGLLPLALALFALLAPGAGRERWRWALIAAGGLLLAFGGATPLYWLARAAAPGFTLIRDQERAVALWSFGLCVLAGFGAAALEDLAGRRARLAALGVGALALLVTLRVPLLLRPETRPEALAFYDRAALFAALTALVMAGAALGLGARLRALNRAAPLALVLVVIVADLYVANGRYALSPGGDPAPVSQAVRFIQADPAVPFRISSESLLPGEGDAAMIFNLEDVIGSSSLEPAAYGDFWQRVRTDRSEGTILALLNVKYILTQRNLPPIPGRLTLAHTEDDLRLYRIEDPLPRAYVVYSATLVTDTDAAAAVLRDGGFDPRRDVVLNEGPSLPLPGPVLPLTRVGVQQPDPAHLFVTAELVERGWLVISQRAYPGWLAYVDGQPAPAYRADLVLTAIPLEAGRHTVAWVYEPQSLWLGAAVSFVALVIAIALIFGERAWLQR
jgi:hypothetical protein